MRQWSWFTRREFLRNSGVLVGGLAARQSMTHKKLPVISRALLNVDGIEKFVDALPVPPVIRPSGSRPNPEDPKATVPFYRIAMGAVETKVHRDLKPVKMWGYGGTSPGPTVETRSGQGVLVEWANELPTAHLLPLDHKVHGAETDKPDVRAVTHLHGAKAPPNSDGYPEDWYVPGQSATYFYPNRQDACQLWYHDHAMGITRLNVYAGMFGNFFVRDSVEASLNLPSGKHEIPILLYDRLLDEEGQLYYPVSPDPESPWVSEVFGDAILVNGKLFPYLDVEPRRYRIRLLNASNGRFYHLTMTSGRPFIQIGTDLGLLAAPAEMKLLTIGPAERADLILDFAGHAGERIQLVSDSRTLMEFRVAKGTVLDRSSLPSVLKPIEKIPEEAAIQTRWLTLGEKDDRAGNAERMLLNNTQWHMPVTENPALDSVEIWNFMNFTDDTHPIHLHLVRMQILERRKWEPEYYYDGGRIQYTGPAVPPAPNEAGWKDTVQAYPGMITRVIMKFEGYAGRYVWHCHLLEHEDNEMMRPYEVGAKAQEAKDPQTERTTNPAEHTHKD